MPNIIINIPLYFTGITITGPGLGLIMYVLTTLEFLNITLNFIY